MDHPNSTSAASDKENNVISQRHRLDQDVLTARDIEALITACSRRAPTGIRNRALIAITWRCGLRISETLALKPKDVDLDEAILVVQHGKGDKRRVLGLDAGTVELVQRWQTTRASLRPSRQAPLFCTLKGTSLDTSYIRHLLPRLAARADLQKRVHAHALRHTFATELEAEGTSLSTIRDALGHSSAAVTDRYLRRISGSAVTETLRRRDW